MKIIHKFEKHNCHKEYNEFEWWFEVVKEDKIRDSTITGYVVYNPYTDAKNYYCTAIIYFEGGRFRKNYGFSNYKNTLKYVLKAMLVDIKSFKETGYFEANHILSDQDHIDLSKYEE